MGIRWTKHLLKITKAGYQARDSGLPKVAPYKGKCGFNYQRNAAWLEGWRLRDREIKEQE